MLDGQTPVTNNLMKLVVSGIVGGIIGSTLVWAVIAPDPITLHKLELDANKQMVIKDGEPVLIEETKSVNEVIQDFVTQSEASQIAQIKEYVKQQGQ